MTTTLVRMQRTKRTRTLSLQHRIVLPHAVSAERLRGNLVIIIHGTEDERLGIEHGRAARDRLSQFPLDITYREFPMMHTATDESLAAAASWLSQRL